MGQIANQMVIDALFKILRRHKSRKKDKEQNKVVSEKNKPNK